MYSKKYTQYCVGMVALDVAEYIFYDGMCHVSLIQITTCLLIVHNYIVVSHMNPAVGTK
jgi:hypothetical protein